MLQWFNFLVNLNQYKHLQYHHQQQQVASTVQNIDFSLSVHNPDNAAVFLTHQMFNILR